MTLADAALVLGYVLAVPFTVFVPGFLRLWRRRELWVFLTAQTGALLVTVGWAVKGSLLTASVNAAWLVGLTVAWAREGHRRDGRRPDGRRGPADRPADWRP